MSRPTPSPITLDDLPEVLSVKQLQAVFQVGADAAYALIRTRAIRSVKIGQSYRIPKSAVREFLNRTQEAT